MVGFTQSIVKLIESLQV